jgi:hypothetical protein
VDSDEVRAIDGLIARVAPEARVITDYRLIAALAGRRVLWASMQCYNDGGAPNGYQGVWPITFDAADTVLLREDDPVLIHMGQGWGLEARDAGYGLWRRLEPPEGGFPEPVP